MKGAWGTLLAAICAVFLVPALVPYGGPRFESAAGFGPAIKPPNAARFETERITALRTERPSVLFIGNSNLESRLDVDLMTELRHERVGAIALPATAGLHWYLLVRNVVIASGVRPDRVVVMFRADELTQPGDMQAEMRDSLRHAREPELERLADAGCRVGSQRTQAMSQWVVGGIWPLSRARPDDLFGMVDALAPSWMLDGRSVDALHDDLDARFARERRRRDEADLATVVSPQDFSGVLPCSTLGAMVTEAGEDAVPLSFMRVRRRPDRPVTDAERRYGADLDDWLAGQSLPLLDLGDAHAITADWYTTQDHIAFERKQDWTRLAHTRMREAGW